MKKVIHIIANDGSPLGVTSKSIWGLDGGFGVGGAELALLTMCEEWTLRGYDVTLYNNPTEGGASVFKQKTLQEFDPSEDRDYLIVFRSPNERIIGAKGKVIWWSCDQHTVGEFDKFAKRVEKIVVISKYHAAYFKTMYGINNTIAIDLPVRIGDYHKEGETSISKGLKKCIYTSIPDRGVMQLHAAWVRIAAEVPDASLTITSDWRLWDKEIDKSCVTPYQLAFAKHPRVTYIGAVNRKDLIKHQLEADLLLYPCTYEELFCITVAEAQVAGVVPVTSKVGAVETTNEFGYKIDGHPYEPSFIDDFVQKSVSLLQDPDLAAKQLDTYVKATRRFHPHRILQQWEDEVFK